MKQTVMTIEDNNEMAALISIFLRNEGFHTLDFGTAEEGLDYLKKNNVDIILVDINLPGMDGFMFISHARKLTSVPILIITARRSDTDAVAGLGFGADDFITKPFSSEVLVARIRAFLRRAEGLENNNEKIITFGPFEFFPDDFVLKKDGDPIPLSNLECRLLAYLINRAGKYAKPEVIHKDVWKNEFGDLTVVAVYIQRLRRKIEDDPSSPIYLKTSFGRGYGFCFPDAEKS